MPARTMSRRRLKESRLSIATLPPPVIDEAGSTGVVFTTLLNPDGDGKNYRLAAMLANCTLKVDVTGYAQGLLVGGGSGSGASSPYGSGGDIIDGDLLIPAARHAVSIGAGGAAADDMSTSLGGETNIGTVTHLATGQMTRGSRCSRRTFRPAAITDCYSSSITGTLTYYGIANDSFASGIMASGPRANRGDGGGYGASTAGAGSSGVAYLRWEI